MNIFQRRNCSSVQIKAAKSILAVEKHYESTNDFILEKDPTHGKPTFILVPFAHNDLLSTHLCRNMREFMIKRDPTFATKSDATKDSLK